jgi:hypothetical protein
MATPAIPLKEFDVEWRRPVGCWSAFLVIRPRGSLTTSRSRSAISLSSWSWMPGWIATSLHEDHIDLGKQSGYSIESTETLLAMFDANVRDARTALETVMGSALDEPWSLKHGERVLFTAPRGEVVRQHLNDLIHHRGQLTVYLRLVNVPLPSVHGPTADERW